MERFVFVAAVTIAIIWGVVAMFGGGRFIHIDGDWDIDADARLAPLVEVAPGSLAAQTYVGNELSLRHLAANVVITTEDRADYTIEIANPAGRAPMPEITVEGGRITVDGRLSRRIERCTEGGGADLREYGSVSAEDLPRVTIRAPRTLQVSRSGAGTIEIGPSQSLDLDFSSCGTGSVGDVTGPLDIDLAGSGQITAGSAQTLNADVAGSGVLAVGAVAQNASVDIAGSGEVRIASLNGDLSADGAGSGNLSIQGGSINEANVDLAGSGDVDIAAPVRSLQVSIVGSGSLDVTAEVGSIDADIAGSGNVRARSVTGSVSKEVWGSGDVRVGG